MNQQILSYRLHDICIYPIPFYAHLTQTKYKKKLNTILVDQFQHMEAEN